MSKREVWITGIGLASSLGEGAQAHVAALGGVTSHVDGTRFAPYRVHPAVPLAWVSSHWVISPLRFSIRL